MRRVFSETVEGAVEPPPHGKDISDDMAEMEGHLNERLERAGESSSWAAFMRGSDHISTGRWDV